MRIGFIGLGTRGSGRAGNLIKTGHELVLHDANPDAATPFLSNSATCAASPREVAESVDLVFLSLPGPPQVESVSTGEEGILKGLRVGAAVFDLSTNSPMVIRELHDKFKQQGGHLLEAPVSGGPSGAHSGKLALWIGG